MSIRVRGQHKTPSYEVLQNKPSNFKKIFKSLFCEKLSIENSITLNVSSSSALIRSVHFSSMVLLLLIWCSSSAAGSDVKLTDSVTATLLSFFQRYYCSTLDNLTINSVEMWINKLCCKKLRSEWIQVKSVCTSCFPSPPLYRIFILFNCVSTRNLDQHSFAEL